MLSFFEVKSAIKELSAKGQLTARTRVRPGRYDVMVGDKRFQSLLVSEPHINSSVPQRGLTIECGLDAFDLERDIRKGLESPPSSMVLKPIARFESTDERITEQFELAVRSLYVYVTLVGYLVEPLPDHSDEIVWVLVRKDGCLEQGTATWTNDVCSHLTPEAYQLLKHHTASVENVEFPITIAGEVGQLQKRGEHVEVTFSYHSDFVDSLAANLKAVHRCLIPISVEKLCANQELNSVLAKNVDWHPSVSNVSRVDLS